MTVYECKCGFSSTSSAGFKRHVTRNNKDNPNAHGPAEAGDADLNQDVPPSPTAKKLMSPKRSIFGSLFSSSSGKLEGKGSIPAAEGLAGDSAASQGAHLTREVSETALEDVDAAWEAVAADVEINEGDPSYPDITHALKAGEVCRGLHSRYASLSDDESGRGGGVAAAVTKSLKAMRDAAVVASHTARRASLDGAPPLQQAQEDLALERGQFPVEAVEAVLLWVDPWLSLKVAGAGFYALLCLQHLLHGVELVQPSTVVAGGALGGLLWHLALGAWARYKAAAAAAARRGADDDSPTVPDLPSALFPASAAAGQGSDGSSGLSGEAEVEFQRRVTGHLMRAAAGVAPVLAAVAATAARRLSGQDKIASVWLGLALWCTMLLGEMRLLTQSSLAILLWAALFCLPWLYLQCRRALDSLIEELLAFVTSVVTGGERGTLLMCLGASACAGGACGGSLFARTSLAVGVGGAVLVWRSVRAAASRAAVSIAAAA